MKKIFMASIALTVLAAGIGLFQLSSCTKTLAQTKTDTVYKTDTIYKCPDSVTKAQILVSKTWMIDQLQNDIDGVFGQYIRGGVNTTKLNYNINRYTFKQDGTSVYIGEDGVTYNAAWKFASSDQRTITFTIYRNGLPEVSNWEMVEIAGKYIHVTQHFPSSTNSSTNLHSYRLIQVP
ncbi:hypothetical protein ACI6Q2_16180 [Chitinophagaceae bacterium LWZ2-11]